MALSTLTIRDGGSASVTQPVLLDAAASVIPLFSLDSSRQVFRVSANFTPQATAGVTVITITGSATKTVRVKSIVLSGVSTALSSSTFQLQRTSALGAGGTLVAPTVAKNDTQTGTATAVVNHWTTTLKAAGTAVGGPLHTWQQFTNTVTTPTVAYIEPYSVFPFKGVPIGQALVLRGVADFFEIQNVTPTNLGAGTVLAYSVEWEEDAS